MRSNTKKKVLFIHQNYPAQFRNFAPELAKSGYEVYALRGPVLNTNSELSFIDGIKTLSWLTNRQTTFQAHPFSHDIETKLIRAEATAICCDQLKKQGWNPDLIIGHPGWGEMLFIKHIWPNAPQLHFLEFFYSCIGLDTDFDSEFQSESSWRDLANVTIKNASPLLNLEIMNQGISPTSFQAYTFPKWSHSKINVVHDGIDTKKVAPNPKARINLGPGKPDIKPGDPVITFVNRTLEPYRGYHQFIRSLPEIQKACPEVLTVIVGDEGASYGPQAPEGKTWKNIFLDEVINDLDLRRIIFTGSVEYDVYLALLQISACHIYLTYPFVLSWSCLEAMSCGTHVIGSKTAPVEEVIQDGVNGVLVNFFDQKELAIQAIDAIKNPLKYKQMKYNARKTILEKYDLANICLPQQIKIAKSFL